MITIQLFRRFALIVLVLAVGLFVPRATQAQGALGNDAVQSAEVVVSAASALTPWDSTPSPDAKMIYFTAAGGKSGPGVFSVAATGGAVKVLAVGAPLIMPLGIAVSSDGKTLYVADQGLLLDRPASDQLYFVDVASWAVRASVKVGRAAHGVVASEDGTRVFVTNVNDATVSVVDPIARAVVGTVTVGAKPNGISHWHGDGGMP